MDLDFCLRLKIALMKYNADLCTEILFLRPGQVKALRALVHGQDCLAVLPTGYGKSMVYELLPYLFSETHKKKCIAIIVVPLNAIALQVVNKLGNRRCIQMKEELTVAEEADIVKKCKYKYIVGHPEDILAERAVNIFKEIGRAIHAFIIVDEAHCVLDWGEEFRPKFRDIHELYSFFKKYTSFAMTATSTREGQSRICQSLYMRSPTIINTTPVLNRNIKLNVFRRPASTSKHGVEESYKAIFKRYLHELYCKQSDYPRTIIYSKLNWCGFAFEYGKMILGERLYSGMPDVKHCRIAQYHSPQMAEVNQKVIEALSDKDSPLRLVFATVALGMGADLRSIKRVVHAGIPNTIEEYTQEIGRAGRDGSPAEAFMFYNSSDVAPNLKHVSENIRKFTKENSKCRREVISEYFSCPFEMPPSKNACCDICAETDQEQFAVTIPLSLEHRNAIRHSIYTYINCDASGELRQKILTDAVEHISETAEFLQENSELISTLYNVETCVADSISRIIQTVVQQNIQ